MDIEEIKKLIEEGYSIQRIAYNLKLDRNLLKETVKTNSFSLKKELFAENEIPRIIELYNDGVSAKTLGIKFSIDKRRIQKWVKDQGTLRNKNDSHRVTNFDQYIFDTIDTPAKAYWLGFFYADAYNCKQTNTFTITLQLEDYDHLVKLAGFVGLSKEQINCYDSKIGDKLYPTCSLRMYSKHICETMTRLGCPQKKSFIIKYPEWMPEHLNVHFIRGMFDGDGCITKREKNDEWKWSLTSTSECAEKIQSIILAAIGKIINYHCISKTENNTYELETQGNEKITKVMSWLYETSSADIQLERKYKKFQDLLKQQSNRQIGRESHFIQDSVKHQIYRDLANGLSSKETAKNNKVSSTAVKNVKNLSSNSFDHLLEINGNVLTADYLRSISNDEKNALVDPIFYKFRENDLVFPSYSEDVLKAEYQKLYNEQPDLTKNEIYNNNSLATNICKAFCHSYYNSTERGSKTIIDIWNDDKLLKEVIRNRLVLTWKSKTNESFNISTKMIIQGMRSMRIVPATTMFKPSIAKFICLKYSETGDLVGDYSCGFGGRLLGAISCGRRYIGTDPLTVPELEKMVDFYKFKDCELIKQGSEDYCGIENSVDLYWSSPPYFDQEYYSIDTSQAYNKGEDYFYNVYWKKTLNNVKYMLKPGKWFGLNVKNYPRMFDMASEIFGEVKDIVYLRTGRSHLTKAAGNIKMEGVFMFKNDK